MSERVLLTGATSGIGRAVARALAQRGDRIVLASRSAVEVERLARDLEQRYGAQVSSETFDALDCASNRALIDRCLTGGALDGVIFCHGVMFEQSAAEADPQLAWEMTTVNLMSPIAILEAVVPHFEARQSGWLAAISSVAGDRGRRSNALYGASKAALDTYLEGLEARLSSAGVRVITVKPGPVDTRMTWGRDSPLVVKPERVARDLLRGVRRGRSVVYTPWFWRPIMAVLRMLPRRLFRRLPL